MRADCGNYFITTYIKTEMTYEKRKKKRKERIINKTK